ncbi:MAG TPA: 3-hydroxyacyl-CoA dehydrogenase NAD-binding domain-containing protein, partial [Longimicrobiales bacterium]|nr:3-hydroxyacyl-CoA dehydrogenase NAD-binding domain-containing protein [Longimicrobiales bacterium]
MGEIRKVAVLGGGLMGSGIAEVAAKGGYDTTVREVSTELAEKARGRIEKSLGRAVDKGKLEGSARDETLGRISYVTELPDLADADLIIEAVTEDLELKKEIFGKLDKLCPPDTVFASNTSSLTIVDMAAATERPDRMVGL